MANNGYVFDCKQPLTKETVAELCMKFIKERLQNLFNFAVNMEDDGCHDFSLWDKTGDGVVLLFDLSTYDEYDGEDEDGEAIVTKQYPCVQIRHGHGGAHADFMWWIDTELQHYLAYHLKGKMADDAHEEIEDTPLQDVSCLTFRDYVDSWKVFYGSSYDAKLKFFNEWKEYCKRKNLPFLQLLKGRDKE